MNSKLVGFAIFASTMFLSQNIPANNKSDLGKADYELVSSPERDIFIPESSSVNKTKKSGISNEAKILSDAWSKIEKANLKPEFFQKVINCAKALKTDPIDFTFILHMESQFNPQAKNGDYVGLIQMDKSAFEDCAIRMIEYETYLKNNPNEKISLNEYISKSQTKGFKKPTNKKIISFANYKKLPREKQIEYSEYYLKYRIHEKKLNKLFKIPSNQLWALIHRPRDCKDSQELKNRQKMLNAVKYGGTVGKITIKGIKETNPKEFQQIMNLRKLLK